LDITEMGPFHVDPPSAFWYNLTIVIESVMGKQMIVAPYFDVYIII
jgi:hypothetical protein